MQSCEGAGAFLRLFLDKLESCKKNTYMVCIVNQKKLKRKTENGEQNWVIW